MSGKRLILSLVLCVGLMAPALADTIVTKDGRTLTGQPVEITREHVKIATKYGDLTIPRADIKEHRRSLYKVGLQDGKSVVGYIVGQTEEALELKVRNRTRQIAWADIKSVSSAKPETRPVPATQPRKLTPAEHRKLHTDAIKLLQGKKYTQSIALYEKILKASPSDSIALYNVACAYSLMGKKAPALDYLKRSIEAGYVNFVHMTKDPDLDNIRKEAAYKRIMASKATYIRKAVDVMVAKIRQGLAKRKVDVKTYKTVYDTEHNFLYLHTKSDQEFSVVRKGLEEYAEYQWKTLFQNRPQQPIYIVMLGPKDNGKVLRRGIGGMFQPSTNILFCGDMPGMKLVKADVVTHEFTHALHFADMQARRQGHPIWLIEGLATLFESSKREGGKVVPGSSARLGIVQAAAKQGRALPWAGLMKMTHPQFMRVAGLAYAQSRYVLMYMYEKGLLKKFYDEYTRKKNFASDKTAAESVEVVFGKPLPAVEREWKAWLMKQKPPSVPFMGVMTQEQGPKLVVRTVFAKSPAAKAGFKVGDVVVSIEGAPIRTRGDLLGTLGGKDVGDTVTVVVLRGDQEKTLNVTLGDRAAFQRVLATQAAKGTGYLGLTVAQAGSTIRITKVDPGSPAQKVGLKEGMTILEFDGKRVRTIRAFLAALKKRKAGDKVKIKVRQGRKTETLTAQLKPYPTK